MKNTGIWLDLDKAILVEWQNNNNLSLKKIQSNIEHFHVVGGSGTKQKGGPQDVVQDSKYLERKKHQLKDYFFRIASRIKDTDALVITGPAETYLKFEKELKSNYKYIHSKLLAIENMDSMTDNQLKAWFLKYFKSQQNKLKPQKRKSKVSNKNYW